MIDPITTREPLSPMTIGLRVTNVQQALDFYTGMGFQATMVVPNKDGTPQFCHLRYGASSLVFDAVDSALPFPDSPRERAMKAGPRGLGVLLGLDVPDIAPLYQYFKDTGCEVTCEPTEAFWCDRLFIALDPFGYQWEFRQGSQERPVAEYVAAAQQEWGL